MAVDPRFADRSAGEPVFSVPVSEASGNCGPELFRDWFVYMDKVPIGGLCTHFVLLKGLNSVDMENGFFSIEALYEDLIDLAGVVLMGPDMGFWKERHELSFPAVHVCEDFF